MLKILRLKIIGLTTITILGCSVIGIRTVEEPEYDVLHSDGEFEVRRYKPQIIAKYTRTGNIDDSTDDSFRQIADYIFGANEASAKVAMTAPVVQSPEERAGSEKIAMTAPVVQSPDSGGWSMYFVMPSKYSMETLPKPKNPSIKLEQLPSQVVAVQKYSGLFTQSKFNENSNKLQQWITENGYQMTSEPRSARYDPPWTIPFLRRNEVQITINDPL